ncbi:phospholipase D-like domain-containing protein [soil metagenome]
MDFLFGYPWWLLLLAAIGLIALIVLVLNLFSKIGARPTSSEVTHLFGVKSPQFLLGLAGILDTAEVRGGTARLLNNGDEFLPAMLDSFRNARSSINFMVYIWEDGEMSDAVFDALIAAAHRGVQVRVMIDGFGGLKAPSERIQELRDAGGWWEWFHPPRFGKLTRFHRRNHRRAIVVDGKIGFTGGAAVMDKWLGDAEGPEHWRDCMVELHGPLAVNLQSAFSQLWAHVTGEMLLGDEFYPQSAAYDTSDGPGEHIAKHVSVVSSPSGGAHIMRFIHWLSCRCAEERIYITNPYFVPDDVLARVLQERARAGIDVRVLVPNEHNDLRVIRWASHHYYEDFLEAGVRIYEYQPTMIHQKLIVVDGILSVVGSANMDVRSKELNLENALVLLDHGFAQQMEETFFEDLSRAREIDLAEFRNRPFYHRIVEGAASLFEEQF